MKLTFLKYFTVTCLSLLFFVALVNRIVDPLQYYQRTYSYPLCPNARWQVPCFIKNFSFDTVIVGTSMTQNFSLSQIHEKLHLNAIKLSIAGASIREQLVVMKAALESKKVKHVIWGMDRYYFYENNENSASKMPIPLYRQTFSSHLIYLLNIDTLVTSLVILKSKEVEAGEVIENYNSWGEHSTFGRDAVIKNYQSSLGEERRRRSEDPRTHLLLLREIESLLEANPSIRFVIFLPPYSCLFHKKQYESNQEQYLLDAKFRELLLTRLIRFNNVEMYDFETDLKIITNLDNYKDLTHYSKDINREMIERILLNKNRIVSLNAVKNSQKVFLALPTYTVGI